MALPSVKLPYLLEKFRIFSPLLVEYADHGYKSSIYRLLNETVQNQAPLVYWNTPWSFYKSLLGPDQSGLAKSAFESVGAGARPSVWPDWSDYSRYFRDAPEPLDARRLRFLANEVLCLLELDIRSEEVAGDGPSLWVRGYGPVFDQALSDRLIREGVAKIGLSGEWAKTLWIEIQEIQKLRARAPWPPMERLRKRRRDLSGDRPEEFNTWFMMQGWVEYPSFVHGTPETALPEYTEMENLTPSERAVWRMRPDIRQGDIETTSGQENLRRWLFLESYKEGFVYSTRELISLLTFDSGRRCSPMGKILLRDFDKKELPDEAFELFFGWENFHQALSFHLNCIERRWNAALEGKVLTLGEVLQKEAPEYVSQPLVLPYLLEQYCYFSPALAESSDKGDRIAVRRYLDSTVQKEAPLVYWNTPWSFYRDLLEPSQALVAKSAFESVELGKRLSSWPDWSDYRSYFNDSVEALDGKRLRFLAREVVCLLEVDAHADDLAEEGPCLWLRGFGPFFDEPLSDQLIREGVEKIGLFGDRANILLAEIQKLRDSQARPSWPPMEMIRSLRADAGATQREDFNTWFMLQGWIEYPSLVHATPEAACLAEFSGTERLTPAERAVWSMRSDIREGDLNTTPAKEKLRRWLFLESYKEGFLYSTKALVLLLTFNQESRCSPVGKILLRDFDKKELQEESFELFFGWENFNQALRFHLDCMERRWVAEVEGKVLTLGEILQREVPRVPRSVVPSRPGVVVVGYARNELGIGEDARTCYQGFETNDLDARLLTVQPPGHPTPSPHISVTWKEAHDFELDVNLFCLPLVDFATLRSVVGEHELSRHHNIVFAPWEFGQWPKSLDFCFENVKEVWAPSRFVQQAYERFSSVRVHWMPLAVSIDEVGTEGRAEFGLPEEDFLFGFFFDFNSLMTRKNPMGLIKAFQMAFPKDDGVGLIIKTMYQHGRANDWDELMSVVDLDPRIRVVNEVMPRSRTMALMKSLDAYVSLHRSEGFGRTLAEAMLLGVPVISPVFSGTADFAFPGTVFDVEHKTIQVKAGEYPFADGFTWADPNLEHAAERMRQLRAAGRGAPTVQTVVERARHLIQDEYSPRAVGAKYARRVREILATKS